MADERGEYYDEQVKTSGDWIPAAKTSGQRIPVSTVKKLADEPIDTDDLNKTEAFLRDLNETLQQHNNRLLGIRDRLRKHCGLIHGYVPDDKDTEDVVATPGAAGTADIKLEVMRQALNEIEILVAHDI